MAFSRLLLTLAGVLLAQSGSAQYNYSNTAATNSASYSNTIAQGSLFVVFGDNIGPAVLQQVQSYPLPLQLAGTTVSVVVNGVTIVCPMVYSFSHQVAAILPSNTPAGDGTFTVGYGGLNTFPHAIKVVPAAFGTYTVASSGVGPGIITGTDYVTKTPAKPAKVGEVVILWGTGLGPITGNEIAGPGVGQFSNVEVFVGTTPAKVIYAGRSGCCAGVDQIAFQVPNTSASCFVPVAIRTGTTVSNFVTLPVSGAGEACVSAAPGLPAEVLTRAAAGEQLKIAAIAVGPVATLHKAGFSFAPSVAAQLSKLLRTRVSTADVTRLMHAYQVGDTKTVRKVMARYGTQIKAAHVTPKALLQAASVSGQQGAAVTFEQLTNLAAVGPQFAADVPAVGSCTVIQNAPLNTPTRTHALDAGATLAVNGPAGQLTMTKDSNGEYQAAFGSVPGSNTQPGMYTISGQGGKDVGPFTTSFTIGSGLTWTNKSSITSVDRSAPLTLTWTAGSVPGHMMIGGSPGHSGVFLCVADTQAGTFTIPQFILGALPAGKNGNLFISPHPLDKQVTIPGVDLAYVMDGSSDSLALEYR